MKRRMPNPTDITNDVFRPRQLRKPWFRREYVWDGELECWVWVCPKWVDRACWVLTGLMLIGAVILSVSGSHA